VLWNFEFALDKSFVEDNLRLNLGRSLLCQTSTCPCIGSKLRCMRSAPTEILSASENDVKGFASTGVNTRGRLFPNPRTGDLRLGVTDMARAPRLDRRPTEIRSMSTSSFTLLVLRIILFFDRDPTIFPR
jgi:hypothetical protein